MRRSTLLLIALALTACPGKDEPPATDSPTTETPTGSPTEATGTAPSDPMDGEMPEPAEPAYEPQDMLVKVLAVVRKVPSDDKKIDDPEAASGDEKVKKVSNWVATLYRGEPVTAVGEEGEWTHIQLLGGEEGWMKTADLISREGDLGMGVVFEDTRIFTRPEITALSKRQLPGGSLVFTYMPDGDFVEVDYPKSLYASDRAWLRVEDVQYHPGEVEVAQMLIKATHVAGKDDPLAVALGDLARDRFPGMQLTGLLPQAPEEEADPEATPDVAPEAAPAADEATTDDTKEAE